MMAEDHDATVRIQAQLDALDRLILTMFEDRDLARALATDEQRRAIDRVNERLGLLIDSQQTMMPRAEAKLLIDALGARLDSIAKGFGDLSQTIAALRSSLSGQSTGVANAESRADRSRNLVFAVIATSLTVIGLVTGLLLTLR